VIVRGGEPAFFEPDIHGPKLGTAEIPRDFHLSVARLFPGDTLLIGSDGRDDVVLKFDVPEQEKQSSQRMVNDDENRFLELVRLHGTDIRALERSIEENANLTDDLSLLSITFVGPLSVNLDDDQYVKQLASAREHVRAREFEEAVRILSRLVEARPDRTEGMFSLVTALVRLGDFAWARQLSRRIAWREPRHAKNLLQLAALEAKAGQKLRARELAQRAADHDSSLAEKANRLAARLEQ
jgi:tetratricopeptide (TPR) repeat protein